jgi:hypothetical protein
MDQLKQNVEQLHVSLATYESKKNKTSATALRKCLMDVSKSCGLARKEVLEGMKSSVVHKVKKDPKVPQNSEEEDNGDIDEPVIEVIDDIVDEKPKRTRKTKKI